MNNCDGTSQRVVGIHGKYYKITLTDATKDKYGMDIISNHITYWIRQMKAGIGTPTLKYAKVDDMGSDDSILYIRDCNYCDLKFKTQSGYLRHCRKKHIQTNVNGNECSMYPNGLENDCVVTNNNTKVVCKDDTNNTMGYIYCFSNPSMPGIYKIGMTRREVETRLKESNSSDTWRPPTEYVVEFYRKVNNPLLVERKVHEMLNRSSIRISEHREFFRSTLENIKQVFETVI